MSLDSSIKEILLVGGKVTIPYKEKVDDWYGEVSITIVFDIDHQKFIQISPYPFDREYKIDDIDNAIEYFMNIIFSNKNVVFLQQKAMENLNIYDYEGEHELTELIEREIIKIRDENKKLNDLNGIFYK